MNSKKLYESYSSSLDSYYETIDTEGEKLTMVIGDPQEDDEYDEESDSDDYFYDENDDEDLY